MTPEEKVQKLIALKSYETPPEGYFDGFLSEFQCRQREELLKRSSVSLFFERAGIWFRQLGASKWLLGAGLAYALLTVVFIFWQERSSVVPSSSPLTPASYQAHPAKPIPAVDFENGKRYPKRDSRRDLRREF